MTTMEQEVEELKVRIERLEAVVRRLAGDEPQVALPSPGEPADQELLLPWLKMQGLVRDPTPEERRLAAEWDALSEEEKQAHIRFMTAWSHSPLSQVLIDSRR
jgi:hypothetical protein